MAHNLLSVDYRLQTSSPACRMSTVRWNMFRYRIWPAPRMSVSSLPYSGANTPPSKAHSEKGKMRPPGGSFALREGYSIDIHLYNDSAYGNFRTEGSFHKITTVDSKHSAALKIIA